MIYSRRIMEVVHRQIATWPVVILEGPRTVGKSTLLREIAKSSGVRIVDLDEPDIRRQVEADPQGYVRRPRPVLIDEYPKIPQLIQHIKAQLNRDGSPGQFVLTGSASLEANMSTSGCPGRPVRGCADSPPLPERDRRPEWQTSSSRP